MKIYINYRRAVLRKWKELNGDDATYGKLLRVCCEENVASVAEAICDVLKSRVEDKCEVDGTCTFSVWDLSLQYVHYDLNCRPPVKIS